MRRAAAPSRRAALPPAPRGRASRARPLPPPHDGAPPASYAQVLPACLHSSAALAASPAPARLDLLLATMGGSILALQTSTPVAPLRVAGGGSSAALGRPGALLEGAYGAHFAGGGAGGSGEREVVGRSFGVGVVIVDEQRRRQRPPGGPAGIAPRYAVRLTLAGQLVASFNATRAGLHEVGGLRALGARARAPLRLRVTNAHGQVSEDSLLLVFNPAFHRALKWLVAAPALALGGAALLPTSRRAAALARL